MKPTRRLLLAIASVVLGTVLLAQPRTPGQTSQGDCSPNIAGNNNTITFTGSACGGIDPADVKKLEALLAADASYRTKILKILNFRDASMRMLVKQAADLAAEAQEALKSVQSMAGVATVPHIARMLQENSNSESDRQAAAATIRDVENTLGKTRLGLSPRNFAAIGVLYVQSNDYDKAAAAFLEAKSEDRELSDVAYWGLAVCYQLQGYQYLQKGDADAAERVLSKATQNATVLREYLPLDSGLAQVQLGFIQKDLANTFVQQGRRAKAEEALKTAENLFRGAIGMNDKDSGAHVGLGDVLLWRGDPDGAIAQYRIATTLVEDYTYAWFDLGLALKEKYKKAPTPDPMTLRELALALAKVLDLQQSESANVQKLPPPALEEALKMASFVTAEAQKVSVK